MSKESRLYPESKVRLVGNGEFMFKAKGDTVYASVDMVLLTMDKGDTRGKWIAATKFLAMSEMATEGKKIRKAITDTPSQAEMDAEAVTAHNLTDIVKALKDVGYSPDEIKERVDLYLSKAK